MGVLSGRRKKNHSVPELLTEGNSGKKYIYSDCILIVLKF